jgi:long-chain acyl-CoA synthetase
LIPNPRDIPAFVKELKSQRFTILPALDTLFASLLRNRDFRALDFSGLQLTIGGGMPVHRSVAEKWKEVTGCAILEAYGLSETSPTVAANPTDVTDYNGTIGVPLPSTEIDIRDEDGMSLPLGKVGEICIRGPQVMAGYWNQPDETAEVMTADGFFRSGDVGVMDGNGFVRIVDRKKDMILVSGFNVYPSEIEDVVKSHPGVAEAAAIGVEDRHSGEVVRLFIVSSDPDLTEKDVRDWCAQRLTSYKRPRKIDFRNDLPRSPVGKILKRELRE